MKFVLRDARPDDALAVAPLLLSTGRRLITHIFGLGSDESRALKFLQASFELDTGSFSYRDSFVAEQDGNVVGVTLGFLQGTRWRKDLALTPLAMRFYQLHEYPKFLRHLSHAAPFGEGIADSAYYLACIAVAPALQGHGAGAVMIERFVQHAESRGHRQTALHVSVENPRAMALYSRTGFRQVRRCGDDKLEQIYGLEAQIAMIR